MSTLFAKTLAEFCSDLRGTFPEQSRAIELLKTASPNSFWQMWRGSIVMLIECDDKSLFRDRRGILAGAVRLTPELWSELSVHTRTALWNHLRTLTLESAIAQETLEPDVVTTLTQLVGVMGNTSTPEPPTSTEVPADVLPFFMERLKEFMDLSGLMGAFADMSGSESGSGSGSGSAESFMAGFPPIPEHLQTGRLATLVKTLMAQFDPTEFGLDPELFKGTDMAIVLKRILEVSKENPAKLMEGAKRMADKIKVQILGGSLSRDAVMAELKEFYELLKDHPLCKEAFEKMEEMGLGGLLNGSGFGGSGSPSDRLRAAQERLRRKRASRPTPTPK